MFCFNCKKNNFMLFEVNGKEVCSDCVTNIFSVFKDYVDHSRPLNKKKQILNYKTTDDIDESGFLSVVLENPDILGDSQRMWQNYDNAEKEDRISKIKENLAKLTNRQRHILYLLQRNNQTQTAKILGIKQASVSEALKNIRKKLG